MITSVLRAGVNFLAKSKSLSIETCTRLTCANWTTVRGIHITSLTPREFRVGNIKVRSVRTKDKNVVDGEQTSDWSPKEGKMSIFPDDKTPDKLYDGVPYKLLHIINIKSTPNNTIMDTTDHKGLTIALHSAGIEGFKNSKKGTSIAAQQAAITHGQCTMAKGIRTVRVRLQGVGPGRMPSIKGLEFAGLNIVSVSDTTRVSWNPLRPRKPRRI